ncbi:MAG: hypothetical protein ABSE69_16685 [Roseiarcus sp.]|jgi:hypothetical protein
MPRRSAPLSSRALIAGACLLTLAVGVGSRPPIAAAAPQDSATVTLDDFTVTSQHGDVITIKHAVFEGANLSKQEIVKMLTPDTSPEDELALVRKLKAASISIPSIDIAKKKGGAIHIHDVSATDVDSGKIGKLGFSGVDGAGTGDDGPVSVKSGALRLENADLSGALGSAGDPAEASPMAHLGFLSWQGVDVVAPDKESAAQGGAIHFALASVESRNNYDGETFRDSATTLKGLIIEPSKGSEFANSLGALGYTSVELSASAVVRYDAEGKKLAVEDITIDYAKAGSIGVKASFGGIDPAVFGKDRGAQLAAVADGEISSLEIKFVNSGVFEKAVAYYAHQQNTTPEALRQQWAAVAGQMLPVMLGGDPAALKVAAEAQKFIAAPTSLTIALRPRAEALKFTDFMAMGDPTALLAKINIEASANK